MVENNNEKPTRNQKISIRINKQILLPKSQSVLDIMNAYKAPTSPLIASMDTHSTIAKTIAKMGVLNDYKKSISPLIASMDMHSTIAKTIAKMGVLNDYKKSISEFKKIDSSWVLSSSVINQMPLINREKDSKYIFGKIPKNNYELSHKYNNDSKALEFVLSNKEYDEVIPVKEVPNVVAVSDVFSSVNSKDVLGLYRHLVEFPMLGLIHPIGKKIFDEINMNTVTVEELSLFRARSRDIRSRQLPFSDIEMFKAPHGFSGQGRYNVTGQGELYTCNEKDVALKEISSDNPNLRYDIIQWKLLQPIKLLNLSNRDSPIVQYCSFEKSTQNGQEYILPNFLSQCAKYHGIYGIVYKSVVNSKALNYVIFDYEQRWFETVELEVDVTPS